MAYRNGTYIAFHAEGKTDPTASDIKYYRMLKAWHAHGDIDFRFVNSHEKASAVRDTSKKATLVKSLVERLRNSRNMVLIIGQTTRFDTDWVPFEIYYAVDICQLPIIAVYTDIPFVIYPQALSKLWPPAFASRINNGTVGAIHIPFKRAAIDDAIQQFDYRNPPPLSLNHYTEEAHHQFGIYW